MLPAHSDNYHILLTGLCPLWPSDTNNCFKITNCLFWSVFNTTSFN